MGIQTIFHRAVHPVIKLIPTGKENAVLAAKPARALWERIEGLATTSTEGKPTATERKEYESYARANKCVATLRREARAMKSSVAL